MPKETFQLVVEVDSKRAEQSLNKLHGSANRTRNEFPRLAKRTDELKARLEALRKPTVQTSTGITQIAAAAKAAAGPIALITAGFTAGAAALVRADPKYERFRNQLEDIKGAGAELAATVAERAGLTGRLIKLFDVIEKALRSRLLERLATGLGRIIDAAQRFTLFGLVTNALDEVGSKNIRFGQSLSTVAGRLKAQGDEMDVVRKRAEEMGKALDRLVERTINRLQNELAETQQRIAALFSTTPGALGGLLDISPAGPLPTIEVPIVPTLDQNGLRVNAIKPLETSMEEATRLGVLDGLAEALTGDAASAIANTFSRLLGQSINSQVSSGAMSASFGAFGGLVGGYILSEGLAMYDKIRSRVDTPRIHHGALNLFNTAAETLLEASIELREFAHTMRQRLNEFRRSLGGVAFFLGAGAGDGGTGTGGGGGPGRGPGGGGSGGGERFAPLVAGLFKNALGIVLPAVEIFVQQIGDFWHVSIIGLIGGVGNSLEEAFRDLLDNFARALPDIIEAGEVSLEGIPEEIRNALTAGVAQTWEELQDAIEVAANAFFARVGPIRAQMFQAFADISLAVQDAITFGLGDEAVRNLAIDGVRQLINDVFGEQIFQGVLDVAAAVEEFRLGLERVGITGREAERLMAMFEEGLEKVAKELLRLNAISDAINLAQRTGVADAREVARLQRDMFLVEIALARFKIAAAVEEGHLRRAQARRLNNLLDRAEAVGGRVAFHLDRAADSAERVGAAAGRIGEASKSLAQIARESNDLRELTGSGGFETPAEWWAAQVVTIRGFADSMNQVGRDLNPLEALTQRFAEFWQQFGGHLGNGSFEVERAYDAFISAWNRLVEQMKDKLRTFRDGLTEQFGQATPMELVTAAQSNFQSLLAAARAGDVDAFEQLQAAAQNLLTLGQQVFGGSTSAFADLFNMVTSGLDQALSVSFDPVVSETQAQTSALMLPLTRMELSNERIAVAVESLVAGGGSSPSTSTARV